MHVKRRKNAAFTKIVFVLELLVFQVIFTIPLFLHSEETGFKYFKNYSYIEYDHQPQNWGIAQAKNGLIYAANHGGVLVFDGVSWRLINVPNNTVRSLAVDKTGTIYVGGAGEIGKLEPDEKGTLKYHSLCEFLQDDRKKFSNVWKTYTSDEGIYFQASEFLFRWDSREIKVWEPEGRFYLSFMCEGQLFIRQKNTGLMRLVGDSLELVPGGEMFSERSIYMMAPFDSKRLLIGTDRQGFYIYDGNKIVPFHTGVDDYLEENELFHGIRLSSGDFALATRRGGLVIMTPQGELKHIFDKTSGLQDVNVKYVFEDTRGNLWLCLDKGISKIEYISPISIHDDRSNLPGIVLSLVRHNKTLYAGTRSGLYYLESPLKFRPIPGISDSCWGLLSIEGSLLAATSQGIFLVKENSAQAVIDDLSFALLPSRRFPGTTWCGTRGGLVELKNEQGKWRETQRYKKITQSITGMAEDKEGNLWLVTSTGGIIEMDFPTDAPEPRITAQDTTPGLSDVQVYSVAAVAGHVMFVTDKGILRFDRTEKKFIPDLTLGAEFADGKRPVFRIAEDQNNNIWFHSGSRNYRAVPAQGGGFDIHSRPFRRIPVFQVNAIYPDPDGTTVWFASVEGLIRYDAALEKNYDLDFPTLIRKISAHGNLIFNGNSGNTGNVRDHLLPEIEYGNRNLHFEFAAPFFEAETETQYRCFLEGYDGNWPGWSKDTKRDYTNLDAGKYTFRVRARNVYQHPGSEDVYRFRILPPWYQAWWAILLYALGLIVLIYGIVRWRSFKLVMEKQKLENIIRERTREIKEKSDQLEKQTLLLRDQSEKLKEMDKVKSRFFANISHAFRTPLTLIMSPLEQMLSGGKDREQKKNLTLMMRNSRQLLTLINQLLDLSRFDSGKMKLHAAPVNIVSFLKGISGSFHALALQNKLELAFRCEKDDIELYIDAPKMEEAVTNLLVNAVKFTPSGGKIIVSVSPVQPDAGEGAEVEISVSDTGIGIPKEQLPHIFDRFFQAKSLGEKEYKGTGIGLALTKEIVLLHHGKINVHSREGKGTEFVIRLPLGTGHLEPGEIADSPRTAPCLKKTEDIEAFYPGIETEENGDEVDAENGIGLETRISENNKTEEPEKDVILVVEDNGDVRRHIRDSLRPFYTVVEARDGKEGLEKARELIPDLIVSDIMMPGVDGCRLCRVLKGELNTSHIPIILLTAKASEESIVEGLETGADDYITKPFNTKILITRIRNLIELRRQLQLKIQRRKMLLPAEISVSNMDEEFLKEFQGIIEKNLSDPEFDIDMLCKKLYMARASLFRKVKALTGETPNQFILSYRLERGAQLLRANFGTVTQVAMEVGFSTSQYFARCFREKFHQSPSSFQASESSGPPKNKPR